MLDFFTLLSCSLPVASQGKFWLEFSVSFFSAEECYCFELCVLCLAFSAFKRKKKKVSGGPSCPLLSHTFLTWTQHWTQQLLLWGLLHFGLKRQPSSSAAVPVQRGPAEQPVPQIPVGLVPSTRDKLQEQERKKWI